MAVEVFANDGAAVITSGGTTAPSAGTVETWTLSGSTLPAVSGSAVPPQQCYVTDPAAGSEKILVTNITGSTATVTRGADGTTPVAHATGFTVRQVLTRASLQALQGSLPVAALPPPAGVAATDTAAVQGAENALAALGGGTLLWQPGTYLTTGLVKKSGVTWQGAGRQATVLRLASGAGADAVQGENFTSLTGTGSYAGIAGWGIRDMTIDGNRAGQGSASWGLRVYGYDFDLANLSILNSYTGNLWTEWGYAGSVSYGGSVPDSMEARYTGLKLAYAGGWGWRNRGPHDSVAAGCIWFENNQDSGTAGNLWCEDDRSGSQLYLGGGLQCIGCHSWGSSAAWGVVNDSFLSWTGGELEGGTYGAMLVRGNLAMSGARAYYLNPIDGITGAGIQLGDDGSTPGVDSSYAYETSSVRVTGLGLDNFAGAGRSSAPLAWVACNQSLVDAACQMPVVTVAAGSNGQSITSLTSGKLDVTSTAGWPATGSVYVATSGGYARCTYTSVTTGGSPSFNGVTYVSGPGGNVATGGIVSGDPLGGTTPDIYSTVRVDQGTGGSSGLRGTLSVQQVPGGTLTVLGYLGGAWHIQGPASNDLVNINTSNPSSPSMQYIGLILQGWKAGYAGITSSWDTATGAIQPGTASGAGAAIYSGTGAPSLSGAAGDIYIRADGTTGSLFYRCTGGTSWSVVL